MPLTHDAATTISDIFDNVANNLYDLNLNWFSEQDILNSIQDQYNKIVALICPIERSAFVPIQDSPYYRFGVTVPDYMYLSAIYNCNTNRWLEGRPIQDFKGGRQSFFNIGNPAFFNVGDIRRSTLWPYLPDPSGVFYLIYKASAPQIARSHVPILPHSTGAALLEYSSTADLLEQARQFSKAALWWAKGYDSKEGRKSVFNQVRAEVKDLARSDMDMVLEPYRWLFHGNAGGEVSWISDEVPTGTVDGDNDTFILARVPNPTNSLSLYYNGQLQYEGIAYTLTGVTMVFNSDYIPQVGYLRAYYQVA